MKRIVAAVLVQLSLLAPALLEAQTDPRPAALLIGNWQYRHLAPLLTPEADLAAMRAALESLDPAFEVTVLANGTKGETTAAIKAFTERHAGNPVVLVYFSGHGVQAGNANYLATAEVDLGEFERKARGLSETFAGAERDELMARLKESYAREHLVSVDGLITALGSMSDADAAGHVKMVFLDACRDPFPDAGDETLAASKSVFGGKSGGGLARVTERPGVFVGMSAAANQVAQQAPGRLRLRADLAAKAAGPGGALPVVREHFQRGGAAADLVEELPPSLFTEHLAGQIARGGSLDAVFGRTGAAVFETTRELVRAGQIDSVQTPAKYSLLYEDFVFGKAGGSDPKSSELARMRAQLAAAEAALAEAAAIATPPAEPSEASLPLVPSVPSDPVSPAPAPATMARTDPEPPGAFPASRGMEGSRAGEVRTFGGIEMVWCPPGEFTMGSPEGERGRRDDETQHRVTLTKGFWLAKTETTQGQWESVMGTDVEELKRTGNIKFGDVTARGAHVAMYFVSWDDAQSWLAAMKERYPLPEGWVWELPTEAQWEYAARAGTTTAVYNGHLEIKGLRNSPSLDVIAWYGGNSSVGYTGQGVDTSGWSEKQYPRGTAGVREVGLKQANAWGLHDMIGNVWEWCRDGYGEYPTSAVTDPSGPETGSFRVRRGGSWIDYALFCRSACRNGDTPRLRRDFIGFRPALVPSPSQ